MKISFNLNNKYVEIEAPGVKRLLDVLRDDFKLTGVKEGCGQGECGACAVIIDGKLINSCCVPAANVIGSKVTTIEGLRDTREFELLDQCFKEAGAVQCGFCIPAMIMASYALLNENSTPTEDDIRRGISGNICRCTGYNMIIDAIKLASERGRDIWRALNR
ncbi:2Fe-2S iron-sulfur cluster binding domain-containing protein [Clostridium tyrobutyricum]|jgi:carbon-monoxide dehydrogenase small subunit|uniref:Xanthine dehydrogenase iron-sulfur subunit n=1 Tax=Clostridium tyrobutyricum DIVETGP TaxID=1408889 RepID=W6N2J2_CLOTY|nr:(2Fe-2S)-binding protein [Clostridium tyrobutyricum]AND84056.1 xanthine dehydrogenase, iron-sulfur binding subunit [Clostridium tyrobutyricum]ANP68790.1 ferredoxin [Clostridium tyrobutyricum]MBV4433533.1 (2Fe-2S)-binding protein [Clostridium tyrobutyricum]MBV4433566.1 (2Fe-2S)-binding protein [Clostridium tyrobutyricum]MBV4449628.1 (2Fe-2S)-binding protein [Clostridium tyrobutyricum]